MSMPPSDVPLEQPNADVYAQLHPKESPDLIRQKLRQFHEHLKDVPVDQAASVHEAQDKCPELLDDDFKLMFLRVDVFHVDLAVKRYCRYWDKRIELMGRDRAFLPLTLDGAFRDDHAVIDKGFMRPIGTRDPTSGRPLVFVDPSRQDRSKYTREAVCRSIWYIIHSVLKDDETAQRKGVLMIVFGKNVQFSHFDRAQGKMNMESIRGALPVRISAFHICHPPTFFNVIFPIIKLLMGEVLRKRVRVHSGSNKQIMKTLEQKFGLVKDVLPTELGSDIVLDHKAWLKKQFDAGL